MHVIQVTEKEQGVYDRFVQAHEGDVQQSYGWGTFRGTFWALAVVDSEDRWLATVAVTRQALPFGKSWLSIARGPLFAPDADVEKVWAALFKGISARANLERAVFLRVELPEKSPLTLTDWRPAHAHYQPEWTLRVSLTPSEEEILEQMKQKGRYNIRLSLKKELALRKTHAPEDVKHFHDLLVKTGGRDGFGIHAEAYYQKMIAALRRYDLGALFLVEHDGMVVAGAITTFYGKMATYFYGASDHAHRALMAPYFLQWGMMREAKANGFTAYDFLGVAPPDEPDHEWAGVTDFKEKFGGYRVQYPPAREWVFSRFWYTVVLWVKRLKK